jgi:purine-binding chemotaxis protein CheW
MSFLAEHGVSGGNGGTAESETAARTLVTMTIASQLLGIPVSSVHDVLGSQKLTRIPLAPDAVAGALNLRGRIVTAIDVRKRLGLEDRQEGEPAMSVVVEHDGEPYSLIIDTVGEVLSIPEDRMERNPPTLDPRWRAVSDGIFRLDDQLLVVLEVDRLLHLESELAS